MAAPIGSQVLGEILPYMELKKDKPDEDEVKEVIVPEIRNMSVKDAEKKLKEVELELQFTTNEEEIDKEKIIVEQIPKPGISIKSGKKVIAEIK